MCWQAGEAGQLCRPGQQGFQKGEQVGSQGSWLLEVVALSKSVASPLVGYGQEDPIPQKGSAPQKEGVGTLPDS